MKKTLLLLTGIVMITACQSAQNPNPNLNSNAAGNQNTNQVAVNGDQKTMCTGDQGEQLVAVRIVHNDKIEGVDDINVSRKKNEKAGWCIENHTNGPVTVLIGSLRLLDATKDKKPPFRHGDWWDNNFLSQVVQPGGFEHVKTDVDCKNGTYEYNVFLLGSNGQLLDVQDPQVIISDGKTEEAKSEKRSDARPGNTNMANKNSK